MYIDRILYVDFIIIITRLLNQFYHLLNIEVAI